MNPSLSRPSASFRLRNPSLNSLRLRRVFDLFDRNGDGEISVSELSLALERLGLTTGGGEDPSDLLSAVSPFIRPGRSSLDYDDFESLHRALGDALFGSDPDPTDSGPDPQPDESDLVEAFKVFDEDGDGFISSKELQGVLGKLGLAEGRSIDRVEEMIGSVDCNKDGRVDFGEFKNMMMSVVVPRA